MGRVLINLGEALKTGQKKKILNRLLMQENFTEVVNGLVLLKQVIIFETL